jgi:hypothetical protein
VRVGGWCALNRIAKAMTSQQRSVGDESGFAVFVEPVI